MKKSYYSWKNNQLLLKIHVQTKASKNSILGEHNERLKISITSTPIDGKANEHLIKFFSKYFGVPQKQITILSGHQSKYKSILILEPRTNKEKFKN